MHAKSVNNASLRKITRKKAVKNLTLNHFYLEILKYKLYLEFMVWNLFVHFWNKTFTALLSKLSLYQFFLYLPSFCRNEELPRDFRLRENAFQMTTFIFDDIAGKILNKEARNRDLGQQIWPRSFHFQLFHDQSCFVIVWYIARAMKRAR